MRRKSEIPNFAAEKRRANGETSDLCVADAGISLRTIVCAGTNAAWHRDRREDGRGHRVCQRSAQGERAVGHHRRAWTLRNQECGRGPAAAHRAVSGLCPELHLIIYKEEHAAPRHQAEAGRPPTRRGHCGGAAQGRCGHHSLQHRPHHTRPATAAQCGRDNDAIARWKDGERHTDGRQSSGAQGRRSGERQRLLWHRHRSGRHATGQQRRDRRDIVGLHTHPLVGQH